MDRRARLPPPPCSSVQATAIGPAAGAWTIPSPSCAVWNPANIPWVFFRGIRRNYLTRGSRCMRRPVDFTSPNRPVTAVAACILALTLPVAAVPCAMAQSAGQVDVASGPHGGPFEVPVPKSQVLRVAQAFLTAYDATPEIADILHLTNRATSFH